MITLVQINVPFLPTVYTPYRSGVWKIALSGVAEYIYGSTPGTFEGLPQLTPDTIGQLRYGLEYLIETGTADEVFSNPNTYFYDNSDYTIIVNIADNGQGWQVPFGKLLEVGIITGFSDRVDYSRADGAYYNNIYHRPCLSSIPDYQSKRDSLFFGVNAYTDISISMLNHDGFFDELDYLGATVALHFCEDGEIATESNLKQKGVVTNWSVDNEKATAKVSDQRQGFAKDIDLGRINAVKYPYADSDLLEDNKIEPIAIGDIENFKPYCVNKEQAGADAKYLLCKAYEGYSAEGVSAVWYYNSNNNKVTISASSDGTTNTGYLFDSSTGLLSIKRATVYNSESDSWTTINVNFTGWTNKTAGESKYFCGVDLIRIGYEIFGATPYRYWNYDLNNFAEERPRSLAILRPVSILIDGKLTITDYLKKVCESTDTITTARGDGRLSVLVIDGKSRDVKSEIPYSHLFNRSDSKEKTSSEILSTVNIDYGKGGDSGNKKTLTDASRETEVKLKYHLLRTEEFETILADSTGAQAKATAILAETITPKVSTEIEIPYTPEYLSLDVVDTIIAPSGRGNTKRARYEITNTKKSRSKARINLTMNKLSDIKYDYGYTQGFAFGVSAFGVHPYGKTINEVVD